MGRRLALTALLVTGTLAWPAAAMAASGSLVNGVMDYQGGGDANAVTFQLVDRGGGDIVYQVIDQPVVSITAAAPCFNDGGQQNVMDCPADGGFTAVPIRLFTASLGDANDTITLVANLPASIGAGGGTDTMNGGPADDFLRGGQGKDVINGSTGNDELIGDDVVKPEDPATALGDDDTLNGGDGNDKVDGQAGNDSVRGAQGDDTLNGSAGNDVFPAEAVGDGSDAVNGGDGIDTATYAARTDALTLSLDDQPNDGFAGSANDNVHSDVENLVGGSAADALSGSDQPNTLDGGPGDDAIAGGGGADALIGADGNDNEGGGDGADSMNGGAGDDSLDGGPGGDVFSGGDGVDTGDYSSRSAGVLVALDGNAGDGEPAEGDNVQPDVENLRGGSGADTFFGSPAGNTLDGGPGEDYSDGGAGADSLVGGSAGDVLRTRGGAEPDHVACGPGPDFVVAKATDVIDPDCDRADRGVNQKPKLRDSALVAPSGGALQMSPAGIVRRVPLLDRVVLPLRSIVDTVVGQVKVTSAAGARKNQTVTLDHGAFDITQSAGRAPVTQFALQGGDFSACRAGAARRAAVAAANKTPGKTVRSLWANGKGSFRTKGRYAAAAIRGTRWQTVDRCDGTLIRVRRGAVTVRDLVKKKTVVVRAGRSYLARR